jgi:hypothetical protein
VLPPPFHVHLSAARNKSDVLQVSEWDVQLGPVDVLGLGTRWLGFERDSHQPMWFKHRVSTDVDESLVIEAYSKGWNLDPIWDTADISSVHSSLEGPNRAGAEKRLGAFYRAWLYLGLLECVLEKEVRVSHLTRLDSNYGVPASHIR